MSDTADLNPNLSTAIPYEIEPVSVGTVAKGAFNRGGDYNDKGAFPHQDMAYTIRCRLHIDRYTRPEAYARCEEIHGTKFDGMFQSGRFYVFYTNGVKR